MMKIDGSLANDDTYTEAERYFNKMMSYMHYIGYNEYSVLFDQQILGIAIGHSTVTYYYSGMSYRSAALLHFGILVDALNEVMKTEIKH